MNDDCPNGGHRGLASLECVRDDEKLFASVCRQCQSISWYHGQRQIDQWDGATIGFGRATVLERLPAVGAPGSEVLVCQAPAKTRLAWLPDEKWVEAAPDLFVAREGRRLLVSSPNPAVTGALTARRARLTRQPRLVPV